MVCLFSCLVSILVKLGRTIQVPEGKVDVGIGGISVETVPMRKRTFLDGVNIALPGMTLLFSLCSIALKDHTLLPLDAYVRGVPLVTWRGFGGSVLIYFSVAMYRRLLF